MMDQKGNIIFVPITNSRCKSKIRIILTVARMKIEHKKLA